MTAHLMLESDNETLLHHVGDFATGLGYPPEVPPGMDGRAIKMAIPESSEMLLDLVALIARSLVDHPEKVTVREVTGDRFPRIELSVAREDIGKVIGKDGRTAQSIRALLNAAASKAGLRAHLDILD